jgi:DNA-3-methyladenine glycosylase
MQLLTNEFYLQDDVTQVARQLLGKVLVTEMDGQRTSGIIVETEAYSFKERGCHAWNMRHTPRTSTMFATGGISYVYLCYGLHHLFNVVTNREGLPEAVLIRALQPLEGIEAMQIRRGGASPTALTNGPAKLSQALGIDRKCNALPLYSSELGIFHPSQTPIFSILSTPRIGIDYAGTDALLPWRYLIEGNPWVSK